jgi:hypothetical protein
MRQLPFLAIIDGQYRQFELVDLYDTTFAEPAGAIMKEQANRGLVKGGIGPEA